MPSPHKRNSQAMRPEWTPDELAKVRRLNRQGLTPAEIMVEIKFPFTIGTMVKRMSDHGMRTNSPRQRR